MQLDAFHDQWKESGLASTYTQIGIPYNHKNGSLARMRYCLNEDGTVKDWVYDMAEEGTFDTFDLYMGNDCSSCVPQAWLTVGNSFWFSRSTYQNPALAEHLGCGAENVMAFGDGLNDLSMIRAAGTGVVMANAFDEVKRYADYITDDCDHDGVAAAIEKFCL